MQQGCGFCLCHYNSKLIGDKVILFIFIENISISSSTRIKAFRLSHNIDDPIDLTTHLPFRVAVVSNLLALNRDWKIRNLCDLEPREMRVLLNIGSYMPIKSADIAYQSRLDSYTVSRAVKKLFALNLIEINSDEFGKNIKNLSLNEAGISLYKKLTAALKPRSEEVESVLTEQERVIFYELLEKIENKTESILAEQAIEMIAQGQEPPADQKELIRWYKKGLND